MTFSMTVPVPVSVRSVLLALLCLTGLHSLIEARPPNVVFIVGDDIGWNDVSWHNPSMITPNLEQLARNGVILNQSYVQPVCSPSRAAFLTGVYPFHLGLQHTAIRDAEPSGVPLNFSLLPELLKHANYATHIVGKWHIGFCKWKYTPTYRGFDSFFGYYRADESYFDHFGGYLEQMPGIDFWDNRKPALNYNGTYSTYCFNDRAIDVIRKHNQEQPLFLYLPFQAAHFPVEAPTKYSDLYKSIKHPIRRIFSGMVTAMDEAVGNVTAALKETGMLDNTVIIFTTDNGGTVVQGGNNWPLRGSKLTLWEGGTRGPAFVYYPGLLAKPHVSSALVHAIDWVPTILSIAGLDPSKYLNYSLDGVDQWPMLNNLTSQARTELVYNIDDITQSAAIRVGQYKLLVGNPGDYDGWYPPQSVSHQNLKEVTVEEQYAEETSPLRPARPQTSMTEWIRKLALVDNSTQLYDVVSDPEERNDLSAKLPDIVTQLVRRLQQYASTAAPAISLPPVNKANPKYWNGTWSPGWC